MHCLLFLTTESFPFRSDLSDNKRDKIKQEKFRKKASSQLTRAYFNCVEDLRVNLAMALWSAYDALRNKGVESSSQASESSFIGTSLPVDYTSSQIILEKDPSRLLFPFVSNQIGFDTGISHRQHICGTIWSFSNERRSHTSLFWQYYRRWARSEPSKIAFCSTGTILGFYVKLRRELPC